jgi:APA family basic amino acid/polyamine antiporter
MANMNVEKTLGFMDLMSIAVGQIIGAGVMVMSISALSMTGRSVNIAFVIAAVFTCFGALPTIFVSSVARFHGGIYSQAAVFVSPVYSGFLQYVGLLSAMSLGIFAKGLVSYLSMLIPSMANSQIMWSFIMLTIFVILNYFGTQWMARVQKFMFYFLIAALIIFTLFGLPKVHWSGYFGNELFGQPLLSRGVSGLLEAASYLTFATGGATVILAFSAEAKNPKGDIPKVVIISTLAVAVLYAFMACVIGGVMPPEETIAAGNLAPIAKQILPTPLYYFFVIGGAVFALGTTLNSSIASGFRPFSQAAGDGWFPEVLGRLNKHGVPTGYLFLRYIVNAAVLLSGFDVNTIGKWSLVIGNVTGFITALSIIRIGKIFPEQWEKSAYHVPQGGLIVALGLTAFVMAIQARMNLKGLTMQIIMINIITFVVSFGLATYLYKAGKIHMNPTYTLE